jgi:hypothetical protein
VEEDTSEGARYAVEVGARVADEVVWGEAEAVAVSTRSSRSLRAEVAAALCSSPVHRVVRAVDAPTREAATLPRKSASGARICAAAASKPLRRALRRRTAKSNAPSNRSAAPGSQSGCGLWQHGH